MPARPYNLPEASAQPDGKPEALLIGRLGERIFALPLAAVERVLRMAALTPLPDAPPGVVGVLNVQGALLPAVDPRPRLGLPTPRFHPDQHLVVVAARTRYLLWLDRAERIVSAQPRDLDAVTVAAERTLAPYVLRLDSEIVPVLSPDTLDPGPIVRPVGERA